MSNNLPTIRLVAIITAIVVVLAMVFMPAIAASSAPLPWIVLVVVVICAIWSHIMLQRRRR